jgi:hypothetical protein
VQKGSAYRIIVQRRSSDRVAGITSLRSVNVAVAGMESQKHDAFGILILDLECAKADGRHALAISQLDR